MHMINNLWIILMKHLLRTLLRSLFWIEINCGKKMDENSLWKNYSDKTVENKLHLYKLKR